MIPGLQELAELLARRFAQYLRAPLANAAPNTTGGAPVTVLRKNGISGTGIGQINGLALQGQTWTVTISGIPEYGNVGPPGALQPALLNSRPWIFARVTWSIGIVKHTADLDLQGLSTTLTVPFDCLDVSIINNSPDGTPADREVDVQFRLAVATAFAGRTPAYAKRTISGSADAAVGAGVRFPPPPFATSALLMWANAPPWQPLRLEFIDSEGNGIGNTTLSPAAPIQRPVPIEIPQGVSQIAVINMGALLQPFSVVFTLAI